MEETLSNRRSPDVPMADDNDLMYFLKHSISSLLRNVINTSHEVFVPEVCVVAHQVPDDRPVADRDERLWNGFGMLAQPGSEATAEENYFHDLASRVSRDPSPIPS